MSSATPALYPVPPIPVLSVVDSAPVLVASPIRHVGGAQFGISPSRARYRLLAPCLNPVPDLAVVTVRGCCQTTIWFGPDGPVLAAECFVVGVGVHGFPFPAAPPPPDSSSDNQGAGFWVSWGFPDWGAKCCCDTTEYAGLVSGGPL